MIDLDLCELFNYFGSDKDKNGYSQIYHMLFFEKKYLSLTLLEIGIKNINKNITVLDYDSEKYKIGGSLYAWKHFFENGRIIGVDNDPETQINNVSRIETYLCNSTKSEEVNELMSKIITKETDILDSDDISSEEEKTEEFKLDIIIDNGKLKNMDQIQTLRNFYPYLKNGGYYIIENIYPDSKVLTMPSLVNCICNHDPFVFVGVKNNMCVIYKQPINSKRLCY